MSRLILVAALLGACSQSPPTPVAEPLPAEGLPASTRELLFGSTARCDDGTTCLSGACAFGVCAGLVTADMPSLAAGIGARLRAQLASTPGLEARVIPILAAMTTNTKEGLHVRGRAARGLVEVGTPAALAELERALRDAPRPLAETIATLLASRGNAAGLDLVIDLSQSRSTARAVEALRALGGLTTPGDAHEIALIELLSALSPDIHLEESRAAIAALGQLGDARALEPLRRFLVVGPDALAHEIAATMRALAGPEAQHLGPDPRRWDEVFARRPAPAPPTYTLRRHESEDDLDLPTP